MSDKLNINDLPREILIKVFRFLDGTNLKNATLSCKLWSNLIESECRWSLQVRYNKNGTLWEGHEKMNFILTTNRKFGTISIFYGRLSEHDQIHKIFQKHGFHIVKLSLHRCRIDNLVPFAELLNITANLKHIVLAMIMTHGVNGMELQRVLPDLKKLKILEIRTRDHRMLKCFRKAKLTTIKIDEFERSQHYGQLVEFLSFQDTLTSLTARAHSSSKSTILAEMGKSNVPIPFRLTELAISIDSGMSSDDHDNILRFVKSQEENLRKLEIGRNIPSSVYERFFASMTKLNTLSVLTNEIPRDNNFYERLKENGSVRTIKLWEIGKCDDKFLHNFLKKLPNIRSLILPCSGWNKVKNENVLEVAQILSKVDSIFISFIDEDSIGGLKFPNLKTLHIEYLRAKINWNEFTKLHPRLCELTIETTQRQSVLTSDDIDQITTNVDLQNIRLGFGFVADKRFFEIIRRNCANLMHKSCLSRGLSQNVEMDALNFVHRITRFFRRINSIALIASK